MKTWIFQGKPERYSLAEKLIEGERETWLVSRFKDEITKGDIVLFWSSGRQAVRGLYGWGEVTQDAVQYFDDWGYGIEVLYKVKFDEHIGVNQVRGSGALEGNVLLTMPIGTNFKLSPQEYKRLCSLIESSGETPPPIPDEEQDNG